MISSFEGAWGRTPDHNWYSADPLLRPGEWNMKLRMAFLLATLPLITSVPAIAADYPKSGEAEYDTYYVFENLVTMDSGAGIGGIDEFTGITRNVKGEELFNDMSVHCLVHWTLIGDKWDGSGSCVETDGDGDNVFTTFDANAHYFVGGTGKYKGITGEAPYTFVELHKTVGGRSPAIVNHKASWKIQ
jgi:hypothetical protein